MATNTYAMTGPGSRSFSGGPHGGVEPGNSAFAGGTYAPAGRPTAPGGAFSTPSATGGPPPSFGTPAAAFARNDRGSNIRIPYARVVSMHSQDMLPVDDPALTGTGRNEAYEYDGLESGELAWIMSKQFSIKGAGSQPSHNFQALASPVDISGFGGSIVGRSAQDLANVNRDGGAPRFGALAADGGIITPSAGMGGAGVNRMERMAYTRWVESHFKRRVGRQMINLAAALVSNYSQDGSSGIYNSALDSEIDYYSQALQDVGASYAVGGFRQGAPRGPAFRGNLFAMPDIAYAMQVVRPGDKLQVAVPMVQGLNAMQKGPFLTSYGVEHTPVVIEVPNKGDFGARAGYGRKLEIEVDRHLGSDLAQRALACELKKAGLFNWTPDGICLSKYETGPDGVSDAMFDARMGQLYNIGIQGPSITKTWSNLGLGENAHASNSDLQVMPMDKVFVCIVGELSYKVQTTANGAVTTAAALTKALARARFTTGALKAGLPKGGNSRQHLYGDLYNVPAGSAAATAKAAITAEEVNDLSKAYATAAAAAAADAAGKKSDLWKAYGELVAAIKEAEKPNVENAGAQEAALTDITAKQKELEELVGGDNRLNVGGFKRDADGKTERVEDKDDTFKNLARALRSGEASVETAELMNFRLMRTTSSYLTNKSHFSAEDPRSRCALKIGFDGTSKGYAEYILGGWCIGTVVDSAASRALGHNGIRSAPTSYAINVNVNVEWWSADKLHQHYMDAERDATGAPAQGTVFTRTQDHYRRPGDIIAEKGQNAADSGVFEAAATQLRTGKDDVEGHFKQPNPYGADTDPKGFKRVGRDGKQIEGDGADAFDQRIWNGATEYDGQAGILTGTESMITGA